MTGKVYCGTRAFDGLEVTVDGAPLDPRFDLKTFSKNGFEWSYEGLEPTQLALAILADAADDDTAIRFCTPFMAAIVANFDNDWELTAEDVAAAIKSLKDQQ